MLRLINARSVLYYVTITSKVRNSYVTVASLLFDRNDAVVEYYVTKYGHSLL